MPETWPDGTKQQPGGWNRFILEVPDLAGTVDALRRDGVRFRNDIVTGVGVKLKGQDHLPQPVGLIHKHDVPGRERPACPGVRRIQQPAAEDLPGHLFGRQVLPGECRRLADKEMIRPEDLGRDRAYLLLRQLRSRSAVGG